MDTRSCVLRTRGASAVLRLCPGGNYMLFGLTAKQLSGADIVLFEGEREAARCACAPGGGCLGAYDISRVSSAALVREGETLMSGAFAGCSPPPESDLKQKEKPAPESDLKQKEKPAPGSDLKQKEKPAPEGEPAVCVPRELWSELAPIYEQPCPLRGGGVGVDPFGEALPGRLWRLCEAGGRHWLLSGGAVAVPARRGAPAPAWLRGARTLVTRNPFRGAAAAYYVLLPK